MTATLASTLSTLLPDSFLRLDHRAIAALFVLLAALSVVLPSQPPELALVFVGAATATLLSSSKSDDAKFKLKPLRKAEPRSFPRRERAAGARQRTHAEPKEPRFILPVQRVRNFECTGFQAQVQELAEQLEPTQQCRELVEQLRQRVEKKLSEVVPVNVQVHISADLSRRTAFAVCMPEVEVVANVTPAALRQSLQDMGKAVEDDGAKLQKQAVRVFNQLLLQLPEMKFRRSAFQAAEPKVTLVWWAPQKCREQSESLPFDFSVNYCLAQHNAALAAFCGNLEPRARGLILLVRRWAKDRGVCYTQKGYLSPYAWTILVVSFLQGAKLLPPLRCAKGPEGPVVRAEPAEPGQAAELSLSELFARFFRFYASDMRWSSQTVSLRDNHHAAQPLLGQAQAQVAIEDPFQGSNAAHGVTTEAWQRIQEELSRAAHLLEGQKLTELLDPWVPPEAEAAPAAQSARVQPKTCRSRDDRPWDDRFWDERQYRDLGKALMQKLEGADAESREKVLGLLCGSSPY